MSNRKGFTLIELLIVVVIIGILAAIAIPKFASTKEKGYLTAVKSDLRNLNTAMEAYFSEAMAYTSTVGSLDFTQSAGVTLPTVTLHATGNGWQAVASHTAATNISCTIYVGASADDAGVPDGAPQCTT